jgi:transposase-like protein
MSRPNHLTLEQKHAFVQLAGAAGTTFAETCRAFRISRQTGYKWLGCYRQAGATGLLARSRWLRRPIQ